MCENRLYGRSMMLCTCTSISPVVAVAVAGFLITANGADEYSNFSSSWRASRCYYITYKMHAPGESINCTTITVYFMPSSMEVDLENRYIYRGDARMALVLPICCSMAFDVSVCADVHR